MKVGSKVRIDYCKNYGDSKFGKIGTVVKYYGNSANVGVELKGDPNRNSNHGYWWFPESALTELADGAGTDINKKFKGHSLKVMLIDFAEFRHYTLETDFDTVRNTYGFVFEKPAERGTLRYSTYIKAEDITNVAEMFYGIAKRVEEHLDSDATCNLYKQFLNQIYGVNACYGIAGETRIHAIKDVIFHDPATIVFWADGTKTVVKCDERDIYDPEKGLAMAITRKVLGNKFDYYNVIKHWLKKYGRSG